MPAVMLLLLGSYLQLSRSLWHSVRERKRRPGARGLIYKISYDLSLGYLKFVVRWTYDSDFKRAEISPRNIVS